MNRLLRRHRQPLRRIECFGRRKPVQTPLDEPRDAVADDETPYRTCALQQRCCTTCKTCTHPSSHSTTRAVEDALPPIFYNVVSISVWH